MIYKFRKWVYVPHVTEIFITADTDKEAEETINKLRLESFNWTECPMTNLKMTYEIVKDVDIKSRSGKTSEQEF
jgi:hypothetical protein